MKIFVIDNVKDIKEIKKVNTTETFIVVYYKDDKIEKIIKMHNDTKQDISVIEQNKISSISMYLENYNESIKKVKDKYLNKALQELKLESIALELFLKEYKIFNYSDLNISANTVNYEISKIKKPDIKINIDGKKYYFEMFMFDFEINKKKPRMSEEKRFDNNREENKNKCKKVSYKLSYEDARNHFWEILCKHHRQYDKYEKEESSKFGYIGYYNVEATLSTNEEGYLFLIGEKTKEFLVEKRKEIKYIWIVSIHNKTIHIYENNQETIDKISIENKKQGEIFFLKIKLKVDLKVNASLESAVVYGKKLG